MNEKALATQGASPNTELAIKQEAATFAAIVRTEVGTIAGVDDHNESRYRFPRLGKLHLGVKKQMQKKNQKGETYTVEYPDKTDYIVLPELLLNDQDFRAALEAMGQDPDKPRIIPIRLVSNNIQDNVRSSLDYYGANRGLKCRSYDGRVKSCVDATTGEMVTGECTNVKCPIFIKGDCQVITRLRFFLPDARGVGVWQIDTRSANNRANIPCEMKTIKAATRGVLKGIDFLLCLEPEQKLIPVVKQGKVEHNPDGTVKTMNTTVYLLHLRTDLTLRKLEEAARAAQSDWEDHEVEDFDTSYDEVAMATEAVIEVDEDGNFEVGEPEPVEPPALEEELRERCTNLLQTVCSGEGVRKAIIRGACGDTPFEEASTDQLQAMLDTLEARAKQVANAN